MNGYLGIHNMNITNEIGTIDNIDDNNNIDSTAFIWSIVCMLIIVGVCFFCFCFLICSSDNRLRVPFPGETDEAEEERRQNRRALILANVIHKVSSIYIYVYKYIFGYEIHSYIIPFAQCFCIL